MGWMEQGGLIGGLVLALFGCGGGGASAAPGPLPPPAGMEKDPGPPPSGMSMYGGGTWVTRATQGGLMLQGGGADDAQAFRWLIARSGGGDAIVLRASGGDGYNAFLSQTLGGLHSVRTLVVDRREHADSAYVETCIRQAELLFIAGGDQTTYDRLWRGTRLEAAIRFLIDTKKAPVGGTSAGMAVLGGLTYIPAGAAVSSQEALADPFEPRMMALKTTFLPHLLTSHLLTDTHWSERDRMGRTVAFLARCLADGLATVATLRGLAADEGTAVAIDDSGVARVFGSSSHADHAFFFRVSAPPERCEPGQALTWTRGLSVLPVRGTEDGRNTFDTRTWAPQHPGWISLVAAGGRVQPDVQTPH